MNKLILVAICVAASQALGACDNGSLTNVDKITEESPVTGNRTIEQVQDAHANEWMNIPGVEGIGIGLCDDQPCIKVYSSKDPEELQRTIPAAVEGYPVRIEQTGTFRAL